MPHSKAETSTFVSILTFIKDYVLWFIFQYLILKPLLAIRFLVTRYTDHTAQSRQIKRCLDILAGTEDHEVWNKTAQQLDKLRGYEKWKYERPQTRYCDAEAIVKETIRIKKLGRSGNVRAIGEYLRTHLHRNSCGITDPMLFRYYTGTKRFVEDYNVAIVELVEIFALGHLPEEEEDDDEGCEEGERGSGVDDDAQLSSVGESDEREKVSTSSVGGDVKDSRADRHKRADHNHHGQRRRLIEQLLPEKSEEAASPRPSHSRSSSSPAATNDGEARKGGNTKRQSRKRGFSKKYVSHISAEDLHAAAEAETEATDAAGSGQMEAEDKSNRNDSGASFGGDDYNADASGAFLPISAIRERASEDAAFAPPKPVVSHSKSSRYSEALLHWAEKTGDAPDTRLSLIKRFAILKEASQSFGRTALLLSGGASLGVYHAGVVRALWQAKLLPRIICGASAGSILAGIFCTRTDAEVDELIRGGLAFGTVDLNAFESIESGETSITLKLQRLASSGSFMDVQTLMECLRGNCQDMTFEEAHERSGRILNVSVAADREGEKSMLLNYITAPNVVIWSAVSASCAMPGLFSAVPLMQKDKVTGKILPYLEGQLWFDGSVACDLPKSRLAQLFNVSYTIVSQVNPHVIPFLKMGPSPLVHKQVTSWRKRFWFAFGSEAKHWITKLKRMGILPSEGSIGIPFLLMAQDYHGDVTILPIGSAWRALPDYINLTTNPSSDHMEYVTGHAQRRTWPHMNQVRWATLIERSLTRALELLQRDILNGGGSAEQARALAGRECDMFSP